MKSFFASRLFKLLVILVLTSACLLIGAVFFYAQPLLNKAQPLIEKQLQQALGGEVSLGKLEISLLPKVRIVSDEFKANISGATPLTIAIERISLRPRLLPLVSGRLEVDRVALLRPNIQVKPSVETHKRGGEKEWPTLHIQLSQVSVVDGTLNLADETELTFTDVESDFLLSSGVNPGRGGDSLPRIAATRLRGKLSIIRPVPLSKISVDLHDFLYSLSDKSLVVKKGRLDLGAGETLQFQTELKTATKRGSIEGAFSGIKATTVGPVLKNLIPSLSAVSINGGVLAGSAKLKLHGHLQPEVNVQVQVNDLAVGGPVARLEKISGEILYERTLEGANSISLRKIKLAPAGSSKLLEMSGIYSLQSKIGAIEVTGGALDLAALPGAIPLTAPYLDAYGISGELQPKLYMDLPSLKVDGAVLLKELEGKIPVSPSETIHFERFSGDIPELAFSPKERGLELHVADLKGSLPDAKVDLFVRQGVLMPFEQKADLTMGFKAKDLSALAAALPRSIAEKVSSYKPSGGVVFDGIVKIQSSSLLPVAGQVSVTDVSGELPIPDREAMPFAHLTGDIQIAPKDSDGFEAKLAGLSAKIGRALEPVQVQGRAFVQKGAVATSDLQIRAAKLSLSNLKPMLPEPYASTALGSVSPDLQMSMKAGKVTAITGTLGLADVSTTVGADQKLSELTTTLSFSRTRKGNTFITSPEFAAKIGKEPLSGSMKAALTSDEFFLDPLKFKLWGGDVTAELETELSKLLRYKGVISANGIDIEKFMRTVRPTDPGPLQGTISRFSVQPGGVRSRLSASSGNGLLEIVEGLLKGVNIARLVLEKLGSVPLIGQSLLKQVPEEFSPYFENDDTPIQKLEAVYQFSHQRLKLSKLAVASDVYGLTGSGEISYEGDLNLNLVMVCDQELSEALVLRIRELGALRNRAGFLKIPFALQGRYPNVQARPDVEGLLKHGAQRLVEDTLIDLLGGGGSKR